MDTMPCMWTCHSVTVYIMNYTGNSLMYCGITGSLNFDNEMNNMVTLDFT